MTEEKRKKRRRPASVKNAPTAQQLYDLSIELGTMARKVRRLSHKVAAAERAEAILFERE